MCVMCVMRHAFFTHRYPGVSNYVQFAAGVIWLT